MTFYEQFDLANSVKAFAPYLDPSHFSYLSGVSKAGFLWLEMPGFNEFLGQYMASPDLWEELNSYADNIKNEQRASTNPNEMQEYKIYTSVNFPERNRLPVVNFSHAAANRTFPLQSNDIPLGKSVRVLYTYPLTYDETELAIDFIDKHVDYEYAVLAIKMCLVDYFSAIKNAMIKKYDFDPNKHTALSPSKTSISTMYKALYENAVDFSMLQDLMPIIANTLHQEGETFSERAMHKSFSELFRRHAFQSMHETKGYQKCPFAKALTKLMSISVEQNDQGQYVVKEDQFPGALILSMRNHIRENYIQALPTKHKVQVQKTHSSLRHNS